MTVVAPIRFLFYPSLGEVREHVRAELFGRALGARLGRPVRVEMAATYEAVEEQLDAGRVDMAWATAEQCDRFEPTARAVLRAVRGGRWYYHSALICRAGANLDVQRLRGTRAAWVAPLSAGGHRMAAQYLTSLGLPPSGIFTHQSFLGSYRKTLLAVAEGEADVTSVFTSHADEHTVRAFLAERVGPVERQLHIFAFTPPTLADGIIITHRLPESEAATLVAALTGMSGGGAGQDLLLGPFNVEGFVQTPLTSAGPPAPQPATHSEYLLVELDAREHCLRLWAPTGTAFGRDVRGGEGRPLADVIGAEAAAPLLALARATRHRGRGGRVEYRLDVRGETQWYVAEATEPPEVTEGPGGGTSVLVRNVTELRTLEDTLYRLASFPQLHPDPMLELDAEGAPRLANPAAHTAFPDLLVQGASHPLIEAALTYARIPGLTDVPRSIQLAGRYWELTLAALPDTQGLRVFARDVTVRKEMETRLIQSDRLAALGSMASAVGHEMNNPLAFMLSNLAYAREELDRFRQERRAKSEPGARELDEVLEALAETSEGADRLKNIVQDLRMLTREPSPHRARVNVHRVLEDVLRLVRTELRHRARLEKELHPLPMVEADEARLGQVFLNILLHSAQAMSEDEAAHNVLSVRTRVGPNGEALIEFQDTAPALPPEVLVRLFEPFYSTHPSTVGLGLSVSHAIVTGMGGSLRAESHPGEGTTFIVTLPPPL
ncbi:PhnD/SsuA/transferrin family substrate-binding protein [Myxococcaceae bacterium GXIMD 01537]